MASAAVYPVAPISAVVHAAVVPNDRLPGVGTRLRADLERAQVSVRGLARVLAGPDANESQFESRRSQVMKWLKLDGDRGLTPEFAERVAAILDTDPSRYVSRAALSSRLAVIERELERYERERDRLLCELAHLPEP